MGGHEVFNQAAEVNSFKSYKEQLTQENSDWTPEKVLKQAQIYYNTEALPNQVKSFFAEKRGDKISHVDVIFKIIGDCLYNNFYSFKKMVDRATPGIARNTLMDFQHAAIVASPGQTVTILDTSGLDIGKGIKYFDTYIKTNDDTLQHLQRYDLTGDQPTLTIDQAKQFLVNLGILDGRQLIADKDKDSLGVLVLPATEDISVFNEQVETQVDQLLATPEIPAIEPIDAFQPQWITDWGMIESLSPVQLPTQEVQKEKQKPIPATTTDFWFKMAVAAAATLITTETPMPVFVANKTSLPTMLDLEGIEDKPVIIFEAPHTAVDEKIPARMFLEGLVMDLPAKMMGAISGFDPVVPTRLDLEGKPVRADDQIEEKITIFEAPHTEVVQKPIQLKQESKEITSQHSADVIIPFRNGIKPEILEKPEIATIVFELATQQKKSTREIQVARGEKGKVEAVSLTELPESADEIKVREGGVTTEEEIPIYQHNWQPVAIKEIPEWVWQGTAAIPDEIIDWPWFLVTMFYVLLNTKVLLKARES